MNFKKNTETKRTFLFKFGRMHKNIYERGTSVQGCKRNEFESKFKIYRGNKNRFGWE